MPDIYQSSNELLFIKNFHVHKARANTVSFFRGLLLSMFGKVDPKLSIYIPDIEKFVDKKTQKSIYKFADVQTSLINITKWWKEGFRKTPFIIIEPGVLQEKKVELSGDNLHFSTGEKLTYGSQSTTTVNFLIGAEDDGSRTEIADVLFSSFSQFYRKNFLFNSPDGNGKYSLYIQNNPVKMSSDSQVSVSEYEKIFIVVVAVEVLLDWQFSIAPTLVAPIHTSSEASVVSNEMIIENTTKEDLPLINRDTYNLTEEDKQSINDIMIFLNNNLDDYHEIQDVFSLVNSIEDILSPQEGTRYAIKNSKNIAVYSNNEFSYLEVEFGAVSFVINSNTSVLFTEEWLEDKWHLLQ